VQNAQVEGFQGQTSTVAGEPRRFEQRNPAPGRVTIHVTMKHSKSWDYNGILPIYQLVQDFFHPQYHVPTIRNIMMLDLDLIP
jgi:hypothetical protein